MSNSDHFLIKSIHLEILTLDKNVIYQLVSYTTFIVLNMFGKQSLNSYLTSDVSGSTLRVVIAWPNIAAWIYRLLSPVRDRSLYKQD